MNNTRKIVEIDEDLCDGCGKCVPACEEGAIQIIDGKAKLIQDKLCDGLGNCLGKCPNDAIRIIEREAEEFDESAVEEHLENIQGKEQENLANTGCPSARLQSFSPCANANQPREQSESALSHWPVQIKLVPPHAPFLQNADLLVTADCVPVAHANYHQFLQGKVALLGCPKFDDAEEYLDKFVQIFQQAEINSVTIMYMEVPCCSGLPGLVERAADIAGIDVDIYHAVISTKGELLETANQIQ